MRKIFLALSIASGAIAVSAQSSFKLDTVWLQRGVEGESLESYFPLVKSSVNPSAAASINTVLQIEELGGLLTDFRKSKLKESAAARDQMFSFGGIKMLGNNLISVDIRHFNLINSMSDNGYDLTTRYYFDAMTGQRTDLKSLFTADGFRRLEDTVIPLLQKTAIDVIGKYMDGVKNAVASEEGKGCMSEVANAFCANKIRISFTQPQFIFSMDDCDWSNPRSHERYDVPIAGRDIDPYLTPYGKYIFADAPKVANTAPFYQLWKGNIGGKLPVTFLLKPACNSGKIEGVEIYDKFGTSIPLSGTVLKDQYSFGEIGPDGKSVAIITATLQNGKLIGTWTKSDKTKTFPFEAAPSYQESTK